MARASLKRSFCTHFFLVLLMQCLITWKISSNAQLAPTVYALRPRGVRVVVPAESGLTAVSFHANINQPITKLHAGVINGDLSLIGRQWTYENTQTIINGGDYLYYWMYSIINGQTYISEGKSFIPHSASPSDQWEAGITDPQGHAIPVVIDAPTDPFQNPTQRPTNTYQIPNTSLNPLPIPSTNLHPPNTNNGGGFQNPSVKNGGGFQNPAFNNGGGFQAPTINGGSGFQSPTITSSGGVQRPTFTGGGGFQNPTLSNGGGSQTPPINGAGGLQSPTIYGFQTSAVNSGGNLQNPTANAENGFQNPTTNSENGFQNPTVNSGSGFQNPTINSVGGFQTPTINGGGGFHNPTANNGGAYQTPTVNGDGGFKNPTINSGGAYQNPTINSGGGFQNSQHNEDGPLRPGRRPKLCEKSPTTVNGRPVCKEEIIMHDTFDTYNSTLWMHDTEFPALPDSEFCVFTVLADNSITRGGTLKIWPTLTDAKYGPGFVLTGRLDLPDCTAPTKERCIQEAEYAYILPPTMSARFSTRNRWSFKYGRVDIVAKLPKGDWIFPELSLMSAAPRRPEGDFVNRIQIALVRGNARLLNQTADIGGGLLQAEACVPNGRLDDLSCKMFTFREPKRQLWTDNFHTYTVLWTEDVIAFSVDGIEIGVLSPRDSQINPTVFNAEMVLVIGVGVGGVRVFPDSGEKPWSNTEPKAMYKFYSARDKWSRTWSADRSSLQVRRVTITSL